MTVPTALRGAGGERLLADGAHGGSWSRHISAAMSQACHMGCWCVGGSLGKLTGVQLEARIILSASKKLRNREATNKSCDKKNVGGPTWSKKPEIPGRSSRHREISQLRRHIVDNIPMLRAICYFIIRMRARKGTTPASSLPNTPDIVIV
jgi:hypothetical protein